MILTLIGIGFGALCLWVCLWDKWVRDCEDAGVVQLDHKGEYPQK